MNLRFTKFARRSAQIMGSPKAFAIAILLMMIWGVSGFFVGFNDSWQLIANTSTTLLTTLMVLLVQNTQNRDSLAMQLKLNEIIRSIETASNRAIALEECEDDKEAEGLREEFRHLRDEDG